MDGLNFYKFGSGSKIGEGFDVFCPQGISIGEEVQIQKDCWMMLPFNNYHEGPRIIIEDGCDIGKRCCISAVNKVFIGRNTIIDPNVHINDHYHQYKNIGTPIGKQGITSFFNEVIIGEGSWLGANSVIVGDVHIGQGCVVFPGSLLNTDIPSYSVAAGVPASVIEVLDITSGEWVKVKDTDHLNELLEARGKASPVISICIPTYNRSNDLDKCLDSIFSQIGGDSFFEVIVSNNNSEDNTDEVIEKYKKFKNLKYFKNENNVGADRNILQSISRSTGQFALIHGNDDFFRVGTLYPLLGIVNANSECGVFFLNLRDNDKQANKINGMESFIRETSIYSTFISSIMLKRSEFDGLKEKDKFVHTHINQVYLQLGILQKNPCFCVINNSEMFYHGSDAPKGYSYGEVFIKGYLDILNHFRDKGLSDEAIRYEKENYLRNWVMYSYRHNLASNYSLEMDKFEDIFIEYYKDEPYFEWAYNYFKETKKSYSHRLK